MNFYEFYKRDKVIVFNGECSLGKKCSRDYTSHITRLSKDTCVSDNCNGHFSFGCIHYNKINCSMYISLLLKINYEEIINVL